VVVFKRRNSDDYPVDYVSPNVKEVFGYEPQHFYHGRLRFIDLVFEEDRRRLIGELAAKVEAGIKSFELPDYRVRRADGRMIWVHEHTSLVMDDDEHVAGFYGYIIDVTRRQELEEELRKKQTYVQQLLDSQNDIVIHSRGDLLLGCNRRFLEQAGYESLEAFLQKHQCVCDLFLPGSGYITDRPEFPWLKQIEENQDAGRESRVRMRILGETDPRIFLVTANRFSPESEEQIVVFTDITELAKAREALEQSNAQLEERVRERTWDLIETNEKLEASQQQLEEAQGIAHLGSWELDHRSERWSWSKEMYRIFGMDAGHEVTTHWFLTHIHPEDRERIARVFREHTGEQEPTAHAFRIIRQDGEVRDVIARGQGVRDDNKTLVRQYGVMQDVTEMIQAARRQKEQERMLAQQSKMAEMGGMIGAIAHQWKQPLNVIALVTQGIEDAYAYKELDAKELHESVDNIMRQVHFLSQTIDDFRNFFKPSKHKHPFSVKTAIEEIIQLMMVQFQHHNIMVAQPKSKAMHDEVVGYPNEFKQVLLNLFNNAKDAILERTKTQGQGFQGRIEIALDEKEGWILITICDNGGGIPDAIFPKLFEPYTTSKGEMGTGIGLSMAKTIIEEGMDGQITVQNLPEGACFEIRLPVVTG